MRIMIFRSYFHDEDHRKIEITEEQYNLLAPHNNDLAMGNIHPDIWDLCGELQDKAEPILERDMPNSCDIECAIC